MSQWEPVVLLLFKNCIVDNASKIDTAYVLSKFRGLKIEEPDEDDETAIESTWVVNQLCICFNLPALSTFISADSFSSVIFPHCQTLCLKEIS